MKSRILYIALFLALTAVFSCQKETSVENPNGFNGTFTALIDGNQWIAVDSNSAVSILDGLINITGLSVDNKEISITLNDTIPGTYQLDQNSISVGAYLDVDSSSLYAYTTNQGKDTTQGGGIVTITSIDKVNKTISGTFYFNVYRDADSREKRVTQGQFYKLSYASTLPPGASTDTMRATINGNNWVGQSIYGSYIVDELIVNGSLLTGNQAIGLIMPYDITPNTYSLNYAGETYIGVYTPTVNRSNQASVSGTLTILENNQTTKRIRGNFEFQTADPTRLDTTTYQISNGYFSIGYN